MTYLTGKNSEGSFNSIFSDIFLSRALQIPAAVAAVSFVFGCTSIFSKMVIFPQLWKSIGITDVISEALIISPPIITIWVLLTSYLYFKRTSLPTDTSMKGWHRVSNASFYFVPVALVLSYYFDSINTFMASYVVWVVLFAVLSAIDCAKQLSSSGKISDRILGPIFFTVIAILVFSLWVNGSAKFISDRQIASEGYEVCVQKCHPGVILASTGNLTAIRYWGSKSFTFVRSADITSFSVGAKGVRGWQGRIRDILQLE